MPGLAVAGLITALAAPAGAQTSPPAPPPPRPAAAAPGAESTAPPAPDRAMALYGLLDAWVRAGSVAADAPKDDLAGAAVTLRLAGQIVGRGVDAAGDGGSLARAAAAAIEEAARRLPVEKDALLEESAAEARQRLCISLELAGPLVPYGPQLYDQADLEVQAGVEGVAARLGGKTAAIFPAAMLASNTSPGDGLAAAIAQITGDATLAIRTAADSQPATVARKHGLTLYRFRITHLAQTGPGREPIFLFRGGRMVPATSIDTAMLEGFADGLSRNLLARKWPGSEPLGLLGTNWPALGRFEPQTASSFERALVAVALQRYLRSRDLAARNPDHARALDGLIDSLLASIDASHTDKGDLPAVTAALCEPLLLERRPATGRFDRALAFDAFVSATLDEAVARGDAVPVAERAVLAWALARRAEGSREPGAIAAAESMVRSVFRDTPPALLTSQMPWLGWAELALTRARGDGEVRSAIALRDQRDQLWKNQLTAEDCGADGPDLQGGIVFTSSSNPLPTAVGLRPMTFAATMLGDRILTTDAELPRDLTHLLAGLRFARQLAADEAAGFMYQDPTRAMWGIRAALWDQRQPPEATAMALLMVVETLESLEARAGTPAGPGGDGVRNTKTP